MGLFRRAIGPTLVIAILVAAALQPGCGGSTGSSSSPAKPPAPQPSPATTSQDKAITAFAFLSSNNPIPTTSVGTITGTSISVFLPPGTDRSGLTATFTAPADAVVTVGSMSQVSGVTANAFNGPVEYTVHAADGTAATFIVTLTTDIASIDNVVAAFMSTYNVPGLSLAITKDENLAYVKAYGRADDRRQASATDLYRIASLSKPLTSVAIMRLVDESRLSLDQRVFGAGAILGTRYGTQPYRPGITDITVDQLLHHTGGGWTNDNADPMFTNPEMSIGNLISWTLDNRPLTNSPGTSYAYSNFGYVVLGRVIEQVTGMPYAEAVRLLVLQPAGVRDMVIAGNTLADRVPNEVQYYSQGDGNPYAFNVARMDAHGGWLASATDLARFLVRVDGLPGKMDILSADAIRLMTTGSAANPSYAAGWSVNGPNWWHTGGLPGTATEQARTTSSGNFNFVILTNTRSQSPAFVPDMDQLFWRALQATSAWPSYDLFTPQGGS
jgi:D-alanyl-D-alanine carboxypeptidase